MIIMDSFDTTPEYAKKLDKEDKLKGFRDEFYLNDLIYLNGNSLGPLSRPAEKRLREVISEEWGKRIIRSWNEGWYDLSVRLGTQLEEILDAEKGTIIVDNTTTVNMFKLIPGIMKLRSPRKKIVMDAFNFPTDYYVIQGIKSLIDDNIEIVYVESEDGVHIKKEDIQNELDEDTALLFLASAAYKSGFLYDMKDITETARKKGIPVLWDISHSVGVVDHSFKNDNIDFAVGCTYKYLNGGPTSPAFLYIS